MQRILLSQVFIQQRFSIRKLFQFKNYYFDHIFLVHFINLEKKINKTEVKNDILNSIEINVARSNCYYVLEKHILAHLPEKIVEINYFVYFWLKDRVSFP